IDAKHTRVERYSNWYCAIIQRVVGHSYTRDRARNDALWRLKQHAKLWRIESRGDDGAKACHHFTDTTVIYHVIANADQPGMNTDAKLMHKGRPVCGSNVDMLNRPAG